MAVPAGTEPPAGGSTPLVQSASAMLRILRVMAEHGPDLEHPHRDIAEWAGLNKPHTTKLLATAIHSGFVERSEHGFKLASVGMVVAARMPPFPVPVAVTRELTELWQLTQVGAAYHVPQWFPGPQLVVGMLDLECDPLDTRRFATELQRAIPQHSAAGRVLLAHLASHQLRTEAAEQLRAAEAESIRHLGTARWRSGGLDSLAAPVYARHVLVGAVTLIAPTPVIDPRVQELVGLLLRTARILSNLS